MPAHPNFRPALCAPLALAIAVLATSCAAKFPGADVVAPAPDARARAVLDASIEAHGGPLWERADAVRVAYEGEWWRIVRILQPGLTDAGYRKTSVETLDFDDERLLQIHQGPDGRKRVERTPDSIAVWYDGERSNDETQDLASALVADAYTMFLTGPSFFAARDAELALLEPGELDGRTHDRLLATLEPGLGYSPADRAVLWIDRETRRLELVHFTLEGLPSTQGAHVDVDFGDFVEVDGFVFPTSFFERVRGPVRVKAHRWRATAIEVARDGERLEGLASESERFRERNDARASTGP